jgi:carboxyl-terminal processing protease
LRSIKITQVLTTVLALVIVLASGYLVGRASASTGTSESSSILELLRKEIAGNISPQTKLIDRALATLKDQYFIEITPETEQQLIYAGVQGMLSVLRKEPYKDDFTNFYDPDLYKELNAETTGNYAGVGILMGTTPDGQYPEVEAVFEGSPALEKGIQVGDVIVEVGSDDAFGMPLPEVAQKIRGEPGSMIHVKVFRPDSGAFEEYEIERRDVHYSSISKAELLNNGVGYIRISNFANDTGPDFRKAMDDLSAKGMKSLVLDLRDNPGGIVDAARDVADCFIKEGMIVEVECRTQKSEQSRYMANPESHKYSLPIVVMINSNSASASEILASALRDYGLARVFGEQSYGKGVVQAVSPLEILKDEEGKPVMQPITDPSGRTTMVNVPKDALAVVIGKYYTPSRTEIHGVGLKPDIYYDYQNILKDDTKVDSYQKQVDQQQSALMKLRAEATKYMRDNDRARSTAASVAAKLASGTEVPNQEKIEPKEKPHDSISVPVVPAPAPDGSTPEGAESGSGGEGK